MVKHVHGLLASLEHVLLQCLRTIPAPRGLGHYEAPLCGYGRCDLSCVLALEVRVHDDLGNDACPWDAQEMVGITPWLARQTLSVG